MSLITNHSLAQPRYISYDEIIIINSNGIVTDVLNIQSKIEFNGDRAVVKLNDGTIMNRMFNWNIRGKGKRTEAIKFSFTDDKGNYRFGMLSDKFLIYIIDDSGKIMLVHEGHGVKLGQKVWISIL